MKTGDTVYVVFQESGTAHLIGPLMIERIFDDKREAYVLFGISHKYFPKKLVFKSLARAIANFKKFKVSTKKQS